MEIPSDIFRKDIVYTDNNGIRREGHVVAVFTDADSNNGEAGFLFSGRRENLVVHESEITSIEIIEKP